MNSGQLNSKQSDSAPSELDVVQDKAGKSTQDLEISESPNKPRFDSKGNEITTLIGRF